MVLDPISGTPQGAAIGLRGIHSNNPSKGFEPAVAVSIDGVYVGTHASQNQTLFDFEQIEIARGPQGTFNGAPAEGGSINMLCSKPTGELGLKTCISAGEFKGRDLDAVLNFPIVDGLARKFTINHQKRDGKDLKNTFRSRRENGIDRTAYALSLLWQARDDVTVQYTIDINRDDSDTPGLLNFSDADDLVCVPDPTNPAAVANYTSLIDARLPESNNPQRFLQNFSNKREFESDSQILRIDAEYMDHQITSITGFRNTKEQFSQDFDGTFVDKFSSTFDSDYDQISTDLRITGQYSDNLSYTSALCAGYRFLDSYRSNPAIPTGKVRRNSNWNASIEYAWDDYQIRVFSQNINDKRFILNIDQSFDAQYVPLISGFTATQGIAKVADVNSPRYTGVEFMCTPDLSR